MSSLRANFLPGFVACIAIAALATVLGHFAPIAGAPVFGIVIGMIVAAIRKPSPALTPGVSWCAKYVLQIAIVLLGFNLGLVEIFRSGAASLPLMLVTLLVTLAAAHIVGKTLGIAPRLRTLLGVGTAICGGSAIAAVSSVIDASQGEIAYAVSTIFLFNVVAVLIFPLLGHAMQLSQHAFGLWAGTAINDTSSVVAASVPYGREAGAEGVIVKLTRTTLIIPIVLFYAGRKVAAARAGRTSVDWKGIVPWFLLWFVLAAALKTAGAILAAWSAVLAQIALYAIVIALSGVGLSADFAKMRSAGMRPLVLGAVLWALIATSSLAVAHAFHLG